MNRNYALDSYNAQNEKKNVNEGRNSEIEVRLSYTMHNHSASFRQNRRPICATHFHRHLSILCSFECTWSCCVCTSVTAASLSAVLHLHTQATNDFHLISLSTIFLGCSSFDFTVVARVACVATVTLSHFLCWAIFVFLLSAFFCSTISLAFFIHLHWNR